MSKKMSVREARSILAYGTEDEREAVRQELLSIAASNITDVLSWDSTGMVHLRGVNEIPEHVKKSIKKVKITPNQYGNAIEVEMHDKLAALRVMARYHGLTEPNSDSDSRPSILGINLKGPEVTSYEVIEDGKNKQGDGSVEEADEDAEGDSKDQQQLFGEEG